MHRKLLVAGELTMLLVTPTRPWKDIGYHLPILHSIDVVGVSLSAPPFVLIAPNPGVATAQ